MSAEIMRRRERYYRSLQITQPSPTKITGWLIWFLDYPTDAPDIGLRADSAPDGEPRLKTPDSRPD